MGFFRKTVVLTDAQERQITAMSKFYGVQHQKLMDQVFEDGLSKLFSQYANANRPKAPPHAPSAIKLPVKK